jgi:heptosyltransferase III
VRVLLARGGALGDLVLLRETVAAVRAAGHSVALFAPPAGDALVGPGPSEVDERIPWESPAASALFTPRAIVSEPLRVALGRCGRAVLFSRNPELADGLRGLVPFVSSVDPVPAGCHAAEWMLRAVGAVAARLDAAAVFAPTAAETEAARRCLEALPAGFLCVHPGSGSPAKVWPSARFADLAGALAEGRPWLLVEGPADARAAEPLRDLPGVVLARGLPLRVLGALLAPAGLFVGNDSGVSHLAAAYGAPTLALFGPTDPALWAPRGPRVRTLRAHGGRLDELELDVVEAAARDLPR